MRLIHSTRLLVTVLGLGLAGLSLAADNLVQPLQDQWAEIKYRQPAAKQAEAFHGLAEQAQKLRETHPNRPDILIWEGIILSSEAGAKGGLGALSLVKTARERYEASLAIDERALDGSAYNSLATLYAKVPGWPIGFGDKQKAETLFRKALAINPSGIDPNFFYGEYLLDQGRTAEGRSYLEKALQAPARPGRALADEGRRKEIQTRLAQLGGKDIR